MKPLGPPLWVWWIARFLQLVIQPWIGERLNAKPWAFFSSLQGQGLHDGRSSSSSQRLGWAPCRQVKFFHTKRKTFLHGPAFIHCDIVTSKQDCTVALRFPEPRNNGPSPNNVCIQSVWPTLVLYSCWATVWCQKSHAINWALQSHARLNTVVEILLIFTPKPVDCGK